MIGKLHIFCIGIVGADSESRRIISEFAVVRVCEVLANEVMGHVN